MSFFWNFRISSDFCLGILDLVLGILEFLKIRHCEGAKRPKQSRSRLNK